MLSDVGDQELVEVIQEVGMRHYSNDTDCPLNWEPSGSDVLSPCLQEADLMSRLIEDDLAFGSWLESFKQGLTDVNKPLDLEPGNL